MAQESVPLIYPVCEAVADTMAVVLHLENRKMPATVKAWFLAAEAGEKTIGISTITLAEIGYLSEKKRISLTLVDVQDYARRVRGVVFLELTAEVVAAAFKIDDIPELHDRLIAGTALEQNITRKPVPVLTNDPVIAASRHVVAEWV